jgi:3-methyladenine DNA glycosylase/8-oxoguanine DNA glycosylase
VAGATTLTARLVERWGAPLKRTGVDGLTHLFPAPADLARARIEDVGLPRSRADAIRSLSTAVATGALELGDRRDDHADDETVAALLEIPGIGPWTAGYVALRGLGLRDAIPVGDLGLRQALGRDGEALSATAVANIAERWRPFRGLAATHLWTGLILDPPRPD